MQMKSSSAEVIATSSSVTPAALGNFRRPRKYIELARMHCQNGGHMPVKSFENNIKYVENNLVIVGNTSLNIFVKQKLCVWNG